MRDRLGDIELVRESVGYGALAVCGERKTGLHFTMCRLWILLVATVVAVVNGNTDDSASHASAASCFDDSTSAITNASLAAEKYVQSSHMFAIDLLQLVFKKSDAKNRNVFFSPHSLWSSLALTYLGAAGNTRSQMARAMRLGNLSSSADMLRAYKFVHYWYQMRNAKVDNVSIHDSPLQAAEAPLEKNRFNIANRLYFDQSEQIKPCLKDILSGIIKIEDFAFHSEQARDNINRWVEERTVNKIRDLIPLGFVDSSTRMVLANAAYFKGTWLSQFDAKNTKRELFFSARDDFTFVMMMQQKSLFNYGVAEELGAHILELPYRGEEISMYILLPPFMDNALDETVKRLTPQRLKQAISYMWKVDVSVKIPKFRIEESYEVSDMLIELGFSELFDGASVNLTGFSASGNLFLTGALHKSFLQLDEEGAEAAAATALITSRTSRPLHPPEIVCNHPFLYIIRDNVLDNILFVGTFERPNSAKLFLDKV